MKRSVKISLIVIAFILLVLIPLSVVGQKVKAHKPVYYRQNILDSVKYIEAPVDSNLGDAIRRSSEFKKLEGKQYKNLTKLLENKNNILWLKIDFIVPDELKGKDIGLFIGRLRSSSHLFINGKSVRRYGNPPPHESSAGFVAQYFMFPMVDLKYGEINTAFIRVWPGPWGSLSRNIFLGEQPDIFSLSERMSFLNSNLIVTFASISFFIFFLYFLLSIVLRKYDDFKKYLFYAFTNFFTAHFLLLFFQTEISWVFPPFISFFTIMKISLCYGGFFTVFFATSFIIAYLGYKQSKTQVIIRIVLLAVPAVLGCALPTYELFVKFIPFLLIVVLSQFAFCVPLLIKDLFTIDKRKNVLHMLQGFAPVWVTLIIDFICHLGLELDDIPYITLYGWQFTIYVFLWQLINQFGGTFIHNLKLKTQLQDFNSNLETVVALRTKELSDANYVLSRGLESVSHVQKNFLPPERSFFKGWDVSIYYQPLDNDVSGDLYDYYFSDSTLNGLGIFDVSGHGIPAGLMTILAKGIISQHFLNGLAQEASISEILEEINVTYIKEKVNVENYITGLLFHFSEFNKSGVCSVEVANAGHPYPILYNAEKDTFTEIKYDNPDEQYGIIGVEGLDVSFPPVSFRMSVNDIIVCFTDGVIEATNTDNEDFSKDRVIKIINEYKSESADVIKEKIIEDLKSFMKDNIPSDDITLIVLKRNDPMDYIEEI